MIKLYTFEEWQKQTLKSAKLVKCPSCDGEGFICEEVQSSSGKYHDIEEGCDRCEESGQIEPSEVVDGEIIVPWRDYFDSQVEVVRKYCSWLNIPFFDGMCQAKQLFKQN